MLALGCLVRAAACAAVHSVHNAPCAAHHWYIFVHSVVPLCEPRFVYPLQCVFSCIKQTRDIEREHKIGALPDFTKAVVRRFEALPELDSNSEAATTGSMPLDQLTVRLRHTAATLEHTAATL